LLIGAQVWAATTYWVRTDGHDTNCNGRTDAADSAGVRPNCAFRTIQKGINSAYAGDTVNVRAGNYVSEGRIRDARSGGAGTPPSYITIQGYTGDTVYIQSLRTDYNYTKFDNFYLTNPGTSADGSGSGIIVSGAYGIVSNCYIAGHDTSEYVFGVLFDGGSYNTLLRNTFEGHFFIVFAMHSPNNTMENNIIKNITDVERVWDAIFASTSNSNDTIVRGNEVYNQTNPGKYYTHADIFQVVNQGGSTSAHRWIIENNYFHDCDAQVGINEASGRADSWVFRNNVFANIYLQMMLLTPNTKIYNNTFFQVGQSGTDIMDAGENGLEIKNNILIGRSTSSTQGMINVQCCSPAMDYNFYSLPRASGYGARDAIRFNSMKGTGSINGGTPKFVAAYDNCVTNTCDFRLRSDSPLKDAGATLTGFTTDKNGITRPQGAAWDIGAFEIAGPSSPSNLQISQ
jgi:hypothetical protein